ncbi:hypothetical protein ORI89_09370 [Sphingobacterium sp. UT-1RO-CII-1]|nr:hypothetical protein [Sphingobacterium sp. UT-1RO-CII-1]MCY4779861.1 hypothetical protein [Sphingobacterium sp. UT-1RO-CII-1]
MSRNLASVMLRLNVSIAASKSSIVGLGSVKILAFSLVFTSTDSA